VRISLVSSSIPPSREGGSEVYAAGLARALAEEHEVVLFTGAAACLGGIECVRLPALPELGGSESQARKAIWHLRDQWLPAVHRELGRGLGVFAPDVVHTHHPQGLSGAVFTAIAAAGVPHVHTAHDANALCARITMTREGRYCGGRCSRCLVQRQVRARLLARGLNRLIAPSDHFRELHVRAGIIGADRALTIRQGAAAGTERLRDRAAGAVALGFIGALAPHKGLPTLLRTLEEAPREWCLRVAGSGPLEDAVRARSTGDPRMDYVGVVGKRDKDAFLNSLDVLVIPSEYEENAPLVATEAAVRGLPAVVSDRGGLPETPEAVVFPAADAGGLLGAIRSLVETPGALREASARLIAGREQFLWSRHVLEVEQVLAAAAQDG
jgi:glycosyltransferase involved in cell wall biosynthesis